MYKSIFCCFKIKAVTLFIGLCDLFTHLILLFALCAAITRPSIVDYYMQQLKQQDSSSSSSSSYYAPSAIAVAPAVPPVGAPLTTGSLSNEIRDTNSNNNVLLFNKRYDNNNDNNLNNLYFMNNLHQFNKQDKTIAFMVTICSSFITMMLIYGILKNKPSYLMPYFCIKVFHVIITTLTTLGFYSCLPNIKLWITMHKNFPYKDELLSLDKQTLDLVVFGVLLLIVLVKLYIVFIVWYCYRYMVATEAFRNLTGRSTITIDSPIDSAFFDESSNNNNNKYDEEILIQPPKYEDIIKQHPQQQQSTTAIDNETSSSKQSLPPYPYNKVNSQNNNNING